MSEVNINRLKGYLFYFPRGRTLLNPIMYNMVEFITVTPFILAHSKIFNRTGNT